MTAVQGYPPLTDERLLRTMQRGALEMLLRTFTSEDLDGPLRGAVEGMLRCYADLPMTGAFLEDLFAGRDDMERQRVALRTVLATFPSASSDDVVLRELSIEKLGFVGGLKELETLAYHARTGQGGELARAVAAIESITARCPLPRRAPLWGDPEIGPLLASAEPLSPTQRNRVLEAVFDRGAFSPEIEIIKAGPGVNEVFILTFEDTLPGPDGRRLPIRAVWKPERAWFGKNAAFFANNVACYEVDRDVFKTDLVPCSRQAFVSLWGEAARIGCLQWHVSGFRLALDGDHVDVLAPEFEALLASDPHFQEQIAVARTLQWLYSDTDHFASDMGHANYGNILWEPEARKLWLIDWDQAFSAFRFVQDGRGGREVGPDLVPAELPRAFAETISGVEVDDTSVAVLAPRDEAIGLRQRVTRLKGARLVGG